ncbi:MAG: hypothetical protein JXR25_05730 [Pontiellaceae bacterium]|nr:hypothetical protein [Pontiellaceae bacterium]MBN2784307.1 hypothetical protein [Pontiellaceae bacterium]
MKSFIVPALAATGLFANTYADDTSLTAFNPAVSVIVDTVYYGENSSEGMSHLKEEMSGFGHVHADGEEHHHGFEEGFNMRHLELQFSAEVDSYFKASAIAAISEDGAEMETAEIETTCLPWGLQARAGKFFSDFGYINARHSHEWDFTDQPLIYELALGSHGLNEKGAQLSWLAPTPFYLLLGAEVFQGENEKLFTAVETDELPAHDGPGLGVGWIKFSPTLPGNHACQMGLFGAAGRHQEEHDGNGDGTADHWLDGYNAFWGGDAVYKYNSSRPYGQGDLTVQAEYLFRRTDLTVEQHDLLPALVGSDKVNEQDGFYLQGTYGFMPRWRGGLRLDMVGLTNSEQAPDGTDSSYGESWRSSAMVDFSPSEFSRIRFQVSNGDYETEDGTQNVWEGFIQLVVSLGAHGAHKF